VNVKLQPEATRPPEDSSQGEEGGDRQGLEEASTSSNSSGKSQAPTLAACAPETFQSAGLGSEGEQEKKETSEGVSEQGAGEAGSLCLKTPVKAGRKFSKLGQAPDAKKARVETQGVLPAQGEGF